MNKKDLKILLTDLDIIKKECIQKSDATQSPNDLFYENDGYHYKIIDEGLSNEELLLAVTAKQAKDIRSIKNILIFFIVLEIFIILFFVMLYIPMAG